MSNLNISHPAPSAHIRFEAPPPENDGRGGLAIVAVTLDLPSGEVRAYEKNGDYWPVATLDPGDLWKLAQEIESFFPRVKPADPGVGSFRRIQPSELM